MFERIQHYFRQTLWNFPLNEEEGGRHFGLRWLRIACLAFRGFYQNKCSVSASSLTYYTMMSIVPLLAMALAIARGFGYRETLKTELLARFPDQSTAFQELFKYADTFLEQAKGGVIAGFGSLLLFFTVALLLNNIERILNDIWKVEKQRSWQRILGDYLALMLIAPLFFIVASSITVFVVQYMEMAIRILPISGWLVAWLLFLVNLIPYCLFAILFTFIYLIIPNTQVQFSSAVIAGLFSGSLYLFVQWVYIYFQVGVNQYGAIYGSMAALPLFLIWIQVSWFVFLLGAELSYAHQTVDEHEFEGYLRGVSAHFKKVVSLWIIHLAVKKGYLSVEILSKDYQIPLLLSKPILEELADCHILHPSREGYVPSQHAHGMKISDCVELIDSRGNENLPFINKEKLAPFEKALSEFKKNLENSPNNLRMSHVPDSF